jgi:hypothetical protein
MKLNRCVKWVLAFALLLPALTGCSSVTVKQPLPWMADTTELAAFEGEWVYEGQVLHLRFGSDGIGRLASLKWRDDRFVADEGEFIVSKGAERSFLSVRIMENGEWLEGYYVVQYRFTDQGDLILRQPEVAAFVDAVANGRLAGVVEKVGHAGSVVITSPPEKVLAFLNEPANGSLFDYGEPIILKKLLLSPPSHGVESPSLPEDFSL